MADIHKIVNSLLATNTYIYKLNEGKCLIIDPGSDGDVLLAKLDEMDLDPIVILATHGHFDHIAGVANIQRKHPGCRFYLHKADIKTAKISNFMMKMFGLDGKIEVPKPDILFNEDFEINIEGKLIQIRQAPGHTSGSCIIEIDGNLFTGDTLFYSKVSSKIPNENPDMLKISENKIQTGFADNTMIFPGHGASGILKDIKKRL